MRFQVIITKIIKNNVTEYNIKSQLLMKSKMLPNTNKDNNN